MVRWEISPSILRSIESTSNQLDGRPKSPKITRGCMRETCTHGFEAKARHEKFEHGDDNCGVPVVYIEKVLREKHQV